MQNLRKYFVLGLFLVVTAAHAASTRKIVFENAAFRYVITSDACNVAFVDRATGSNYLRGATSPCALVKTGGTSLPATAATLSQGRLTLRFGGSKIKAVLKTEVRPTHITFTVESVSGGVVEALTFLNVPLTLQGVPGESFGACALALNLFTRVNALPALQRELQASCEKKFGIVGAKVAIAAAPMAKMLPTLQQTLSTASALPLCKVAGPWARDIPFNHGSYLFNFGALVETNVEDWVAMTRSLGFTQIDHVGGGADFFRFGDMELNRTKWPDGWEAQRRIVAKLHAAGIGSIFHTYAFFIDKQSKYVTPVPDPRLDAFRTFTLAAPLTADSTEIAVNESTAEMKTITGFFEPNSVALHIGDELVTFGGASKAAPWKFTGVKRGAHGTRAAAHARGAPTRHLKELFGLFVPNVETSLFEELAARHATVVNQCGFDGIYLDAIDGSFILRGGTEGWYWAGKFVVEIQKRLKKTTGMEMSMMVHHFWQYRTRWQAWDFPRRGQKRFIDLHAAEVNGGLMLPLHLGWWGFWSFAPPQIEPSYPDVIEQLGARLIGWDAGISLTAGVNRDTLRATPLFQRAVDTLRTCEELRHAKVYDAAAKAKLREPGSEFALTKNAAGKTRFRRIQSQAQTVALAEPWTRAWRVTNSFAAQPAKLRIEALMAAAPPGATNATVVGDLRKDAMEAWQRTQANGVSFDVQPSANDASCCTLTATNSGQVPRNGAWVRLEKRFEPPLNIKDGQALTVEIEGDGSGAVLAFRLECPSHIAYGAVADRYVTLDFTGCRQLTLVETESSRWSDYVWNDQKHLYHMYRETVDFGAIEACSIWLQNLPAGCATKVSLGPIRAVRLCAAAVTNPKITVAGKTIEFPVKLAAGSWIEANGPEDCKVYGAKGESLGQVTPSGDWPVLGAGANDFQFSCEPGEGAQPRARVVTIASGAEL
jgi:hypothetical protein